MGTRADFHVGIGVDSIWLGMVIQDQYQKNY